MKFLDMDLERFLDVYYGLNQGEANQDEDDDVVKLQDVINNQLDDTGRTALTVIAICANLIVDYVDKDFNIHSDDDNEWAKAENDSRLLNFAKKSGVVYANPSEAYSVLGPYFGRDLCYKTIYDILLEEFPEDGKLYNVAHLALYLEKIGIGEYPRRIYELTKVLYAIECDDEENDDEECSSDYRDFIISGPPGAGKSYFINKHVLPAIINPENQDDIDKYYERVLFSDSLYHEAFFGGYKPAMNANNEIVYRFVPGPFCRILKKALWNPTQNFALVIEEMNRGDAYDIFGELFQLIDRKESLESQYRVSISEEAAKWFFRADGNDCLEADRPEEIEKIEEEQKIYLPSNLYLICTMNNADSGVHYVDTAMKRRFHMVYIDDDGSIYGAADGNVRLIPYTDGMTKIKTKDNDRITTGEWNTIRDKINEIILRDSSADKLLSEHFIKGNSISGDEFIVKVLGYLFQNVFRGESMDDILEAPFNTDKSVIAVLKRYHGVGDYRINQRNVLKSAIFPGEPVQQGGAPNTN